MMSMQQKKEAKEDTKIKTEVGRNKEISPTRKME